jgi:hypothetical protein
LVTSEFQRHGNNMTKYYHISSKKLPSILKPQGHYERVSESGSLSYWTPTSDSPPIFPVSDIAETCFATTIEGALFGLCSEGNREGTHYVYSTTERPDIDLVGELVEDFCVIGEVRYRKPINIKYECSFNIPKDIVRKIQSCQIETEDGCFFFSWERGDTVKTKIRKWLQKNTSCYR